MRWKRDLRQLQKGSWSKRPLAYIPGIWCYCLWKLSSKRPGKGVGLQAVQHTTEKNGGYCWLYYKKGVFCVNGSLRDEG